MKLIIITIRIYLLTNSIDREAGKSGEGGMWRGGGGGGDGGRREREEEKG